MSYKYMLLDSRGAPVAQGVSEDGPAAPDRPRGYQAGAGA